jgi:hypothetical protein
MFALYQGGLQVPVVIRDPSYPGVRHLCGNQGCLCENMNLGLIERNTW